MSIWSRALRLAGPRPWHHPLHHLSQEPMARVLPSLLNPGQVARQQVRSRLCQMCCARRRLAMHSLTVEHKRRMILNDEIEFTYLDSFYSFFHRVDSADC